MTAIEAPERFRQPMIKRLGFEDGWWLLSPHFLKLGLPVVLVDECFLPEHALRHLEFFGTQKPEVPLPHSGMRVEWRGYGIQLYDTQRDSRALASNWYRTSTLPIPPATASVLLLLVGNSYALHESWSALWSSRVGVAAASQA